MTFKKITFRIMTLMLVLAMTVSSPLAWTLSVKDLDEFIQYNAKQDGRVPYEHFDETKDLSVYVNGNRVLFPDTQPYVDENNRTLIPVRFVTEQLGAAVSWDGPTNTATIEKNGTKVDITIGSRTLKVTKNGRASAVEMDTAAVNKDGRTMVPIRFVVEALGGFVDYVTQYGCLASFNTLRADVSCRSVVIYNDVLTATEIQKLRSYPYTYTGNMLSDDRILDFFPVDRTIRPVQDYNKTIAPLVIDMPYSEANATAVMGRMFNSGTDECSLALNFANRQLNFTDNNLKMSFRADKSCAYDTDYRGRGFTITVRGYITMEILASSETASRDHWNMVEAALRYTPESKELMGMTLTGWGVGHLEHVGDTEIRPVDVQVYIDNGSCRLAAIVDLTDSDTLERPGTAKPIYNDKGEFVRLGKVQNANEHENW